MKYLLAIVVLVFAAGEVRAQLGVPEEAPDALHVLTGKVFLERSGMLSERLEVWLTPETGAGKIDTFSESSGNFQFEGLRAGTYTIRVRAPLGSPYGDGEERIAIYVSKTTTRYNVIVTMPLRANVRKTEPAPPPPGTIAVPGTGKPAIPPGAVSSYEMALAATKAGNRDEATKHLEQAVALAPSYGDALNDLGVERMGSGKNDEAIELFRRAAEATPDRFEPRVNLALALLAAERLDEAEAEAAKALAIDPDSPRALFAGGRIALARGELQTAAERLQRSVAAGGDTQAAAAVALGELCERAGQTAAAIEAYRIALQAEPDGPRAAVARARLAALGAIE